MNRGCAHIENRRQDMDKRLPHQIADEQPNDRNVEGAEVEPLEKEVKPKERSGEKGSQSDSEDQMLLGIPFRPSDHVARHEEDAENREKNASKCRCDVHETNCSGGRNFCRQ